MTSTVFQGLTLLEGATHEAGFPAWGVGLIAFGLLFLALMYVLHIGSGRPHA